MDGLIVGIGLQSGATADDILAALSEVFGKASVDVLATVDVRAKDVGLHCAASSLGVRIDTFTAADLAEVHVPNPGTASRDRLGTPSVAEAAAILASGGAALVQQKRVVNGIVLAAARAQRPVP
ncbi:cobalamin biosynthesis protein [Antrihabitans cavernicola]|uniref:Cobalamin biosynthesis protein n=1 Tax=Antrihabitans cavernicola TaxID=2495913 RepID=A0A5A7SDK8_9NOCA|nr:cobalamin biosynthesis protein [Spelaeibacter cavernicola]KAA0023272.1 cobalamin biosynthesis protein [Spelaeibacter cavernicola]